MWGGPGSPPSSNYAPPVTHCRCSRSRAARRGGRSGARGRPRSCEGGGVSGGWGGVIRGGAFPWCPPQPREAPPQIPHPVRISWSESFRLETPSLASSRTCTGSGRRERQSQHRTVESMEPGGGAKGGSEGAGGGQNWGGVVTKPPQPPSLTGHDDGGLLVELHAVDFLRGGAGIWGHLGGAVPFVPPGGGSSPSCPPPPKFRAPSSPPRAPGTCGPLAPWPRPKAPRFCRRCRSRAGCYQTTWEGGTKRSQGGLPVRWGGP